MCNNWRGWKRPVMSSTFGIGSLKKSPEGTNNRFFIQKLCDKIKQKEQRQFFPTKFPLSFYFNIKNCHLCIDHPF